MIQLVNQCTAYSSSPTSQVARTQGIPGCVSQQRRLVTELFYGLNESQEEMIIQRGQLEESIMPPPVPLEAHKPKGAGASGGFGGGGNSKGASSRRGSSSNNSNKSLLQSQAAGHAKVLNQEGVVRIDHVLPEAVVNEMRSFVHQLRATATEEVATEAVSRKHRFADVLLRKNRCDLTLPLTDVTYRALYHVLCQSAVGATLQTLLGQDAVLYEFSCLISDGGSDRQVVHPDTGFARDDTDCPSLYTTFVALQDIAPDMGPTCWLPGTHTRTAHDAFKDEMAPSATTDSPKDALLRRQSSVSGVLTQGSCAMYDSRVLHCGTANLSDKPRALFYFSFKNPDIGYPGNPASIRPELAGRLTLSVLQKELESFHKGKGCSTLEAIAATMQ